MQNFTKVIDDGVAVLELDLPGESVNTITRSVRDELGQLMTELQSDSEVKGVVLISGKPGNFIAGADIDEFVALSSEAEALQLVEGGQALVNRLAELGKPVVAAINGAALGGGLEAALACTYRIATNDPATKVGLPEVQLGIIPAAGGCQRLPRLIGTRAALDMILTGKTVSARRAHRLGIVDEIVHPAILRSVAVRSAKRLASGWTPKRSKKGLTSLALDRNPAGRQVVFNQAMKRVRQKTGGSYPAPIAALDTIEFGLKHGIKAGLEKEAEHFSELAVGDVSRNLVRIFFATTALKKDAGVDPPAPEPQRVRALGVVGAGFMGSAIGGTAVLRALVDVRFRDADLDRVYKGIRSARSILDERLKRRRMTKYEHRQLAALVSGGVDWAGFGRADVVIEAVFEDLEVKHKVFRELEANARDDCVLASNTSTIPIHRIAEAVEKPERVLGMHFFSPVEKMPLLEIIVTDATAAWATVTALSFGRRMGKTVIVVKDRPGFWVNRILSPYLNEAGRLIHEGVPIEQIDRTMKRFGFPVGPITLLDEVGLDVADKGSKVMHEAYGDRLAPVGGIGRLVERGRLGRKSGSGFYKYEDGKRQGVDPEVLELLDVQHKGVPDPDVKQRLVYALLNEAALALSEGVVRSPRDGDIGAVFGIGYPPFRGGPLRHLDSIGAAKALDDLDRLRQLYGDRFKPAPLLKQLSSEKKHLYTD